ncbi:alanine racemase [Phreatobacter stygius]|uniref:Alanine racemase n=1 Tax=Phreatobacter stygius TaxID=1940610 RepID=A0A4D7B321_9HYPH|nr:alanine racemase [Phreatobacter stygius]QCI63976.1 alanine racemase [Phreatobacter stygius]
MTEHVRPPVAAAAVAGTPSDTLPLPPFPVETPCFVILEDAVLHNLRQTAKGAGGIGRLMPHIKTHRAPWLVAVMLAEGVRAFKAATPAEVEIAAAAGAPLVVWAYPTVNPLAIARVARAARACPAVRIEALVDSPEGLAAWRSELTTAPAANLRLRLDLDPGLGRTGVAIGPAAYDLASAIQAAGLFAGWHAYDGHIQNPDRQQRIARVTELGGRIRDLIAGGQEHGLEGDLIAAGSYSFDLWPSELARWVSPGSWTYSSSQHDVDLADVGWQVAGYVLATVLSVRDGTATLDAGSKAISPDIPLADRFRGPGPIRLMKEEHVVIATDSLTVGQQVPLIPRHGCTAAYLYDRALVRLRDGSWQYRAQLGASRQGPATTE